MNIIGSSTSGAFSKSSTLNASIGSSTSGAFSKSSTLNASALATLALVSADAAAEKDVSLHAKWADDNGDIALQHCANIFLGPCENLMIARAVEGDLRVGDKLQDQPSQEAKHVSNLLGLYH